MRPTMWARTPEIRHLLTFHVAMSNECVSGGRTLSLTFGCRHCNGVRSLVNLSEHSFMVIQTLALLPSSQLRVVPRHLAVDRRSDRAPADIQILVHLGGFLFCRPSPLLQPGIWRTFHRPPCRGFLPLLALQTLAATTSPIPPVGPAAVSTSLCSRRAHTPRLQKRRRHVFVLRSQPIRGVPLHVFALRVRRPSAQDGTSRLPCRRG